MSAEPVNYDQMIACPQCDGLSTKPLLKEGQKAVCKRCGGKVLERKRDPIRRTLAVALAGLLLLIPAMILPLIGVSAVGLFNQASLLDCIAILIANDYYLIAISLTIFTLAVPVIRLLAALYISWCIRMKRITPALVHFFRSYHQLDSWTMLHVFLLGIMVSMYKLVALAELSIGLGLVAFILLLICSTLVSVTLDKHYIWEQLEAGCEY
ncbi:paraquat-inducible protein A [Thalassomonas actiniarum]|uniref:Paraquat-inducible protein A n=1 Tax=Thalassomonas actiniarum TaxID=485447 RepID=A0AAF0C1Q0_9GAMM|nr:paraquat-inducible protein A [Thalassomonas actiniarum]WDD99246.1 paraquat-inducible protein A [Thalassomonas actiniarum]